MRPNIIMFMHAPSPAETVAGGEAAHLQAVETEAASGDRADCRNTARGAADSELVERVAGGDRLAMRLLLARYQPHVYRLILRTVRDAPTAEDLTADVFLELWRTARRFKARPAVRTWLLAMARSRALSSLRRVPSEQLDEEAAEIADPTSSPIAEIEHQKRSAIIRRCLARLSAKHREVIDLVYYHEQSVADVAAILSIPKSTVKTRMFYARRRLSALLRDAGIDRTACDVAFSP